MTVSDKKIVLNHLEFDTLCYLAKHSNQVLSKEQIYEAVWTEDKNSCFHTVVCVISQLRKKIGPNYIKTYIGSGYKFGSKS